VGLLDWLLP
jgi:hypothetical protein